MVNSAKDSVKVIINEANFHTYTVRFDLDNEGRYFYDLGSFVKALMFEVPDFAYGGTFWKSVMPENAVELVSEAAKAIYKIPHFKKVYELYSKGSAIDDDVDDDILRRGEFGELILFFLLKNFHTTVPLLSKIYFKSSDGETVHGFDAVHFHEISKTLWLGESKIYENSRKGLSALIKDIKEHITAEYLSREFVLVGKKFKLATDILEQKRNSILEILNPHKSLQDKISSLYIPLLCTFSSKTFVDFQEESQDFIRAYEEEMRTLKSYFDKNNDHPLKDKLNIVLLLMPVQSKRNLVSELHKKLFLSQAIT